MRTDNKTETVMRAMNFALAAMLLAATAGQGQAATILYTNGPINGTDLGYTIVPPYAVTDSFTLGSSSTLSSVTGVGLWVSHGTTLVSVDWSIGSSAFDTDKGFGTGLLTSVFQFTNSLGYDVYDSSFAISGSLGPGTYWLTLSNAVTSNQSQAYWDRNSGASTAFQTGPVSIGSESFTIMGERTVNNGPVVPEPTSLALAGFAGFGMLAGAWRRRQQEQSAAA